MEKPELMLKKLRRLPANMTCPNCGTPAQPGIGFGNVCVKFKTFVCDLCKTSHQAISHRVKSFSMSTWTMEEVMDLTVDRKGGNQVALHAWLAKAPAFGERYSGGSRPKEGDKIEIFKQFITDCYEHGKFKATTPFDASSVPIPITLTPARKSDDERPAPTAVHQVTQQTRRQERQAAVATVAVISEELDLLAFDTPATAPVSQSATEFDFISAPALSETVTKRGSDDFIDFASSPAFSTPHFASAPPPTNTAPSSGNDYAAFDSAGSTGTAAFPSSFSTSMSSSVSMPQFSSVAFQTEANPQPNINGHNQISQKPSLNLNTLYDKPIKSGVSSSAISSLGNLSSNGNNSMYGNNIGRSQSTPFLDNKSNGMPSLGSGMQQSSSNGMMGMGGGMQQSSSNGMMGMGGGMQQSSSNGMMGMGGGMQQSSSNGMMGMGGGMQQSSSNGMMGMGGGMQQSSSNGMTGMGGGMQQSSSNGMMGMGGGMQQSSSNGMMGMGGGMQQSSSNGMMGMGGGMQQSSSNGMMGMGGGMQQSSSNGMMGMGGGMQQSSSNGMMGMGGGMQQSSSNGMMGMGGGMQQSSSNGMMGMGGGMQQSSSNGMMGMGGGMQQSSSNGMMGMGGGMQQSSSNGMMGMGGGMQQSSSNGMMGMGGGMQQSSNNGVQSMGTGGVYGSQTGHSSQSQQLLQPFRGAVTASSIPRGPVDAFSFVGSSMQNMTTASNGANGGKR